MMSSTLAQRSRSRLPEEIALRFMRQNPPIDLDSLVEELNLPPVRYVPLDGGIAGQIERIGTGEDVTYQISINSSDPPARQRFTLAHEIAHYVKHRALLDRPVKDSALYRSHLPEPIEWEANRYAATLLMPLSAMRSLYKEGLRSSADFARRLNVSEQAAEIRLRGLRGSLELEFGP